VEYPNGQCALNLKDPSLILKKKKKKYHIAMPSENTLAERQQSHHWKSYLMTGVYEFFYL
jgi:hypothetical protein